MGLYSFPLSAIRIALMHFFEAARYTIKLLLAFGAIRVGSFYMYLFISSKALSASLVPVKCFINFTKSAHFQNSTIKVDCKSQIELFFVCKDPIFESQDILTSNTHQQSLADASSETRPPMLERGSYIPWVSRFRRFLNRKRENRKWLNKEIDEGPYEFKKFTPSETEEPRMKTKEDLRGDYLKHYEAEIKAMKLILISIPNDIYNSVDACNCTSHVA
ncbi:hypothetical protein Tco_0442270 [Tanacetum coccineum]